MAAIIIIACMAIFFGLLIGIINKFFSVAVDERVEHINELLPGFNCGACGHPGCAALAEAIVEEKGRVSDCKPIKEDGKLAIYEYIEQATGPDGERIDINKVK